MSKASVLALATDLGGGQAQSPHTERLYDEMMLAVGDAALFNLVTLLPVTAGTAEYTLPAPAVKLHAAFYDNGMLSRARKRDMEALDPSWRDHRGHPVAFVTDDLSRRVFRLYPQPVAPNSAFIFQVGAPFGVDHPVDAIAVIHSVSKSDLPTWLDLPLALSLLGREFARDSDHRNAEFASACQGLGKVLFEMVS